jgi:hypothetical protein
VGISDFRFLISDLMADALLRDQKNGRTRIGLTRHKPLKGRMKDAESANRKDFPISGFELVGAAVGPGGSR